MTLVLASRCVDGVIVNAENDTGQNYRLLMMLQIEPSRIT